MTKQANKATLIVIVFMGMLIQCCVMVTLNNIRIYINDKNEEKIFEEKLGISNDEEEILIFLNNELRGLTHVEAVDRLKQWGDVEVETCSFGAPFGRCEIKLSHLLGTDLGYRLTVFYENSLVVSVKILYS